MSFALFRVTEVLAMDDEKILMIGLLCCLAPFKR